MEKTCTIGMHEKYIWIFNHQKYSEKLNHLTHMEYVGLVIYSRKSFSEVKVKVKFTF